MGCNCGDGRDGYAWRGRWGEVMFVGALVGTQRIMTRAMRMHGFIQLLVMKWNVIDEL